MSKRQSSDTPEVAGRIGRPGSECIREVTAQSDLEVSHLGKPGQHVPKAPISRPLNVLKAVYRAGIGRGGSVNSSPWQSWPSESIRAGWQGCNAWQAVKQAWKSCSGCVNPSCWQAWPIGTDRKSCTRRKVHQVSGRDGSVSSSPWQAWPADTTRTDRQDCTCRQMHQVSGWGGSVSSSPRRAWLADTTRTDRKTCTRLRVHQVSGWGESFPWKRWQLWPSDSIRMGMTACNAWQTVKQAGIGRGGSVNSSPWQTWPADTTKTELQACNAWQVCKQAYKGRGGSASSSPWQAWSADTTRIDQQGCTLRQVRQVSGRGESFPWKRPGTPELDKGAILLSNKDSDGKRWSAYRHLTNTTEVSGGMANAIIPNLAPGGLIRGFSVLTLPEHLKRKGKKMQFQFGEYSFSVDLAGMIGDKATETNATKREGEGSIITFESEGYGFSVDLADLEKAESIEEMEGLVECWQFKDTPGPQLDGLNNISAETNGESLLPG